MKKQDVVAFFDRQAERWDADMIRKEPVIAAILEHAKVETGACVLDVACGTGVLIPDYLARGAEVTAVDISPEMVRIAREKFPGIDIRCADAETIEFDAQFDVVMVYNALPHFADPYAFLGHLATFVKPGGRLSVAHSMSREALLAHHRGGAAAVSVEIPEAQALAAGFPEGFCVTTVISNEEMYQVVGIKQ